MLFIENDANLAALGEFMNIEDEMIMRLEKRVREFLYRNSLLTGAAQYLLEREIPKL